MKVGDYIKYKTLSNKIKINRCLEIDDNIYILDKNEATCDKYIIKSSSNIIDLIEVGDYVNGYRVSCISELTKNIYTDDTNIVFKEENIKSIVTKEQFESVEYKVGE